MVLERLAQLADPKGACADPGRTTEVVRLFGLELADRGAMGLALELARRLISKRVMALAALVSLQRRAGPCMFVSVEQGELTGFFGCVALNDGTGETAAKFDPRSLNLASVAGAGEAPAAIYMLGAAGATEAARRAVIRSAAAVNEALFWALPIYTRIATKAGERVLLNRLGFTRVGDTELGFRAPRSSALQGFEWRAR